jgi:cell division protein YceG involved in septum cleavage
LEAAADPAETPYFYYVLVDPDGRHGFSETLEEHNAKVAKAREEGVI